MDEQAQAAVVGWGLGDPQDGSETALRVMGCFFAGDQKMVEGHAEIAASILGDGRSDGWAWEFCSDGWGQLCGNGEGDEPGEPRGMDLGGDVAQEAGSWVGCVEREFEEVAGKGFTTQFEGDQAQGQGNLGTAAHRVAYE